MEEAVRCFLDFELGELVTIELVILPIAFIMHTFCFYIITKHTPMSMREYRKYLYAVQICLVVWDLSMGIFIRPSFIFPTMASGCTGLFSYFFHLDCNIQCSFMFFEISLTFTALATALVYKRFQMVPPGNKMLSERRQKLLLNLLGLAFQTITSIFLYLGGLGANPIITTDPRLQYVTTVHYQLNTFITLWFAGVFSFGTWKLCLCVYFIIDIFARLKKMSDGLSERTQQMQRCFAVTLMIQLAGTIFCFYLPLMICFVAEYLSLFNSSEISN
ncbi:unnamed protein product, partial [Mesorhabditis belari]|uniref:Uncharacterized protein n=1 Tax=Mesorhabditis belari TaxID=2138241 RepID=A0AAF3FLS9_9BILA